MRMKSSWKVYCGYFRADARRFFCSPNWIIASLGVVAALVFSFYSLLGEWGLGSDSDVLYIYTAACEGMGAMLFFIFCTCAFGMTFSEDLENGFGRYAIIRGKRGPYILARAVMRWGKTSMF